MSSYNSSRKGKTTKEIYGIEKAEELKKNKSKLMTELWKDSKYRKKMIKAQTGKISPRKGLTKYTDESVKRQGIKNSIIRKKKSKEGVLFSEEHRKNLSEKTKTTWKNPMYKRRLKILIREGTIKRIERCKLNGQPLTPCTGKQEKGILDYLEGTSQAKIVRQYRVAGYFLDGYCPQRNVAIEIDEPYHNTKELKKKDIERENCIKERLRCQFLRIKVPVEGV